MTRPVLVVTGASREKARPRPLCDCDKDAELETESVRDGVDLHEASEYGEDSDSLFLFGLGATENDVFGFGFWRNEASLCGCGA